MEETPTSPRVTALIVSRNSVESLRRCLAALQAMTARETLEIVVVDNGSQDGSQTMDTEFPDIHMMRLPKNFGMRTRTLFSRALTVSRIPLKEPDSL